MAIRTLKRKVIIREYDYKKIQTAATTVGIYADNVALYDRVTFTPLTQEALEKLKVIEILKGKKHSPLIAAEWNNDVPRMILFQLKDYLYNERYVDWQVTVDSEGYLCVQARKNTPRGRIGWGIFEKDIESRI